MQDYSFTDYKLISSLVPVTEIVVGIGLLIPPVHRVFLLFAILLHGVIIALIVPRNIDVDILPWNIFLIILLSWLFLEKKEYQEKYSFYLGIACAYVAIASMAFFSILPKYLSFQLYSGNRMEALVLMSDQAKNNLPKEWSQDVNYFEGSPFIDLNKMVSRQYNYDLFPCEKVYKIIGKHFRTYGPGKQDMVLIIRPGENADAGEGMKGYYVEEL